MSLLAATGFFGSAGRSLARRGTSLLTHTECLGGRWEHELRLVGYVPRFTGFSFPAAKLLGKSGAAASRPGVHWQLRFGSRRWGPQGTAAGAERAAGRVRFMG